MDLLLSSAGFHIDHLEKELEKSLPDRGELVRSFNEILDCLTFSLPSQFDHTADCKCEEFLTDYFPRIFTLELRIHSVISKEVIVNDKDCWITQTRDKYRLYHQCIIRFGSSALY